MMPEIVEEWLEWMPRIAGVVLLHPRRVTDARGVFLRQYQQSWLDGSPMRQLNRADRIAGCLVGLHYHLAQSDFWFVTAGRARIVLQDLRRGSPTYWNQLSLDSNDLVGSGVYIPPGVGHGFSALSDVVLTYMQDREYDASDELGVRWDDPGLGLDWGLQVSPLVSSRDEAFEGWMDIDEDLRPLFGSSRFDEG